MKRVLFIRPAMLSCLTLMLAISVVPQARAQDPAAAVRDLLARAEQLEAFNIEEEDTWSTNYLRSDAVVELARLAVLTGDEPTITAAQDALGRLETIYRDEGDPYQVNYYKAHRCLTLAALGRGEDAEQLAKQIPYMVNRAYAYNMMACFAMEQKDEPNYTRLSLEADRLFDLALRAEALKDEDDKLYVDYIAWALLYDRMQRVVESRLHSDPASELGRWAQVYGGLALEHGARAECLAVIAYGYGLLGQEALALPLIEQVQAAIAKEEAVDPDSFDAYGLDYPLAELTRAYAALAKWDQAEQTVERNPNEGVKQLCRALIAQTAIRRGEPQRVEAQIDPILAYLNAAEAAITSPDHGPGGFGRQEDDPWFNYESTGLFWDHYYCVFTLAQVGRGQELVQQLGERKTEVARFAAELGLLAGELMPLAVKENE